MVWFDAIVVADGVVVVVVVVAAGVGAGWVWKGTLWQGRGSHCWSVAHRLLRVVWLQVLAAVRHLDTLPCGSAQEGQCW